MVERISKRMDEPIKRYYGKAMVAISLVLFLWACQHQPSAPSGLTDDAPTTLVKSEAAIEILEKHIEAIGGRRALKRIYSRKTVAKKVFYRPPNKEYYTEETTYQQRPGKYYAVAKGIEEYKRSSVFNRKLVHKVLVEAGTDGKVAWKDAQHALFLKETTIRQGADRVNHLIRYAFDMLQYETPSIGLELIGTEKLKGKMCYKLAVTPYRGTPFYYFINKDSLLIDKIAYSTQSGKKIMPEEIFFDKYKETDGVRIPHKFEVYRSGRLIQTGSIQSIETNIAIPADRFAIPSAIQELAHNQFGPDAFNYSPLKKQPLVTVSSKPKGRRRVIRTYQYANSGGYLKRVLNEKHTMVGNVWHGPYQRYFPNGQLMIEESYIMDKIHGPSKHYDADGNLIQEENYHLGKLDGCQIFYCADGTVKIKTNYRMGLYHGRAEIYHKCSGILAGLSFYNNGLLEGEKTAYYADGKIQEKTIYKEGKPHGISLFYHANGQIEAEKTYAHGIKQGVWKYYYDSGKVKAEENYRDDQFHGKVKSYYPSGMLRQETAYLNGLKHGIHQYYYKNGKLKDQSHYKDGKKSGIHKQYAWSGYLWLEENYKADLLDGPTRRFNAKGEITKVIYFKDGQQIDSPKGR